MKTVDEWKSLLRLKIREALGARQKTELTVLRQTLAAIENAEAPPVTGTPPSAGSAFAGSVQGLGAAEVERLTLSAEAVMAIVEREIQERRDAASTYAQLGQQEQADVLMAQVAVLAALQA